MKRICLAVMAASIISTSATAQNVIQWSAPTTTARTGQASYFPLGTPISLATRTQVSTKQNKPGDRIYLEVTEPLLHRGQVIVPVGSVAVGEVADMQRNGHFGKKGKLGIRLLYLQTPSGPIRISGRASDEGTSGTAVSVATIVLVSSLGFLIHGTSANLPSGTVVTAYLADDLRFTVQTGAPTVAYNPTQVQPDGYVGGVAVRAPHELSASFDPNAFRSAQPSIRAE